MQLKLIGSGAIINDLKRRCNGSVNFLGWQSEQTIIREIQKCDFGVIPHLKSEHTDHTIPHKLFQFWACHKPVIVSDCIPLKRIVEEAGGGLIFKSGNVEDLQTKINILCASAELRERLGERGFNAVWRYYNWSTSEKELLRCYDIGAS